MSIWRLQDPGRFPVRWHDVMREREQGKHIVQQFQSEKEAKAVQRLWRLFQFCLREFPQHPTSAILANDVKFGLQRRSRVEKDFITGKWTLWLIIGKSRKNLLSDAEIFERDVDRLA